MKTIKIQKCPLYACGSKAFAAKVISSRFSGFKLETKELRSVDHHFGNKKNIFYQNKVTGERFSDKPVDYTTKKYREFINPDKRYKKGLKRLNSILTRISTPKYLHSKRRRSFKTNATVHKGNVKFIMIDIKSFYPNSRYKFVYDFFVRKEGLNMSNSVDVAHSLAKFVTIKSDSKNDKRIIPQGFPTSVLISFWAYKKMFDEIYNYSIDRSVTFSTYVDDLTFSHSLNQFDSEAFIEGISLILSKYYHEVNKDKIQICDNTVGEIPLITGVLVKRNKVRASNRLHTKLIRTYRKHSSMDILTPEDYIASWKLFLKLDGLLSTINYIEPTKTRSRRKIINRYVEQHRGDYIQNINIKKIKSKPLISQLFGAYKHKNINSFYKKNKYIFKAVRDS